MKYDRSALVVVLVVLSGFALIACSGRIMPINPHLTLLGQEFPPTGGLAKDWSRSTDAIGVTISPGQHREIVLQLRDDAKATGTASGVRVMYSANGRTYQTRSYLAVEMRAAARCS